MSPPLDVVAANAGFKINTDFDPSETPVTLNLSRSKIHSAAMIFFSLLAIWYFATNLSFNSLILLPICVGATFFGIFRLMSTEWVRFEKKQVEYLYSTPLFSHSWRAAYSEFQGLRQFEMLIKSGRYFRPFRVTELQHENSYYCIPLSLASAQTNGRERLEDYARFFHLPILQEDDVQKFRRPEDIDKPLSTLLKEYSDSSGIPRQSGMVPLAPPPPSITVSTTEEGSHATDEVIIDPTPRLDFYKILSLAFGVVSAFGTIVFILLIYLVTVFSLDAGGGPSFIGYIIVLCTCGVIFDHVRKALKPNSLRLHAGPTGEISLQRPRPLLTGKQPESLVKNEIEEIYIKTKAGRHGLTIVGDKGKMTIDVPLPLQDYVWLKDYLYSKF
eukprot:s1_g1323.t1